MKDLIFVAITAIVVVSLLFFLFGAKRGYEIKRTVEQIKTEKQIEELKKKFDGILWKREEK